MGLLDAIRQAKDPKVKVRLMERYKAQQLAERARESTIAHYLCLLLARTGYPGPGADAQRAAAALEVLAYEDEAIRSEVMRIACRHPDWTRGFVEGVRRRLPVAEEKAVEVPGPEVPF